MGTDIHGRLQRRWTPNGDYQDAGPIEDDRNYRVFAMLAGVRNGFGFAGVKTHEPIVPVAPQRGLPDPLGIKDEDWSQFDNDTIENPKVVKVQYADGEFGDHSFSWLTLAELLAWDGWTKDLHMAGILDASEFHRVQIEGGNPKHWCGGISGQGVIIVSPEDATLGAVYTHVEYTWTVPFREYAKTFRAWLDWLELKYGWQLENDPGAVRIVFGFDS